MTDPKRKRQNEEPNEFDDSDLDKPQEVTPYSINRKDMTTISDIRFRGRIGRACTAFVHDHGPGSNSIMFISNFTAWRRHLKEGDIEEKLQGTISHEQLHVTLKTTVGITASRRLDVICRLVDWKKEGKTGLPNLTMLEGKFKETKPE